MYFTSRDHGGRSEIGQSLVAAGTSEKVRLPPLAHGRPITITAIPLTLLTHGDVTDGPFVAGELIDTGSVTAKIIKVVGATSLLVADPDGTLTAVAITGLTSGATATVSAVASGSALVRHTTSPEAALYGVYNIESGLEVYGDWEGGAVTEYTSQCLVSAVTGVELIAITADALFEIVI